MFKKNIKPILMAGALALATAVSPVLADDYTTDTNGNKYISGNTVTLTKTFTIESAVDNFRSETFGYTITANQDNAPLATIASSGSLTFTGSGTQTLAVTFDATQPSTEGKTVVPGTYTYILTETNDGSDNVTTEGATSYTITVRVVNSDSAVPGALEVDQITVVATGDNTNTKTTPNFLNHYNEYADLTVGKEVTGKGANVADAFDFTIEITLPATYYGTNENVTKEFTVTGTGEQAVTNDADIVNGKISFASSNTVTLSGTMKDNARVVIADLPAGTTYTVSEADTDYTETYTLNGSNSATTGTSTGSQTLRNADASVIFTNNKDSSPLTGVIVNNMPYIALLGASGAGLVVLAASKKRSKK